MYFQIVIAINCASQISNMRLSCKAKLEMTHPIKGHKAGIEMKLKPGQNMFSQVCITNGFILFIHADYYPDSMAIITFTEGTRALSATNPRLRITKCTDMNATPTGQSETSLVND